jgi:alpha-acetolactate decarboxylase
MKTKSILLGSLIIALSSTLLMAQMEGGKGRHRMRNYDTKTVETLSGSIISIDKSASFYGKSGKGYHLTVKTEKETITVHLGPSSYLEDKIKLQKGDSIEVTGSRTKIDGKTVIVAQKIKKGTAEVVLRDEDGTPKWAGEGRRMRDK